VAAVAFFTAAVVASFAFLLRAPSGEDVVEGVVAGLGDALEGGVGSHLHAIFPRQVGCGCHFLAILRVCTLEGATVFLSPSCGFPGCRCLGGGEEEAEGEEQAQGDSATLVAAPCACASHWDAPLVLRCCYSYTAPALSVHFQPSTHTPPPPWPHPGPFVSAFPSLL